MKKLTMILAAAGMINALVFSPLAQKSSAQIKIEKLLNPYPLIHDSTLKLIDYEVATFDSVRSIIPKNEEKNQLMPSYDRNALQVEMQYSNPGKSVVVDVKSLDNGNTLRYIIISSISKTSPKDSSFAIQYSSYNKDINNGAPFVQRYRLIQTKDSTFAKDEKSEAVISTDPMVINLLKNLGKSILRESK